MKTAVLAVLAAFALLAQTPTPSRGQEWYRGFVYVPSSTTDVAAADTFVDSVYFSVGPGSGTTTVTLLDKSTNCGGSGCPFWPTIVLTATASSGQVVSGPLGGVFAKGGVTWIASSAATVVGQIKGAYAK